MVLTLITVGLACLLQFSSPVRPDQTKYVSGLSYPRTQVCLVPLIYNNDDSLRFSLQHGVNLFITLSHAVRHSEEETLVQSC